MYSRNKSPFKISYTVLHWMVNCICWYMRVLIAESHHPLPIRWTNFSRRRHSDDAPQVEKRKKNGSRLSYRPPLRHRSKPFNSTALDVRHLISRKRPGNSIFFDILNHSRHQCPRPQPFCSPPPPLVPSPALLSSSGSSSSPPPPPLITITIPRRVL